MDLLDGVVGRDFLFRAPDESGAMVRYEALLSFDDPATGRCYLVYADAAEGDDGSVATYASVALEPEQIEAVQQQYDAGCRPKKPPVLSLADPTSQAEWDLVDQVLTALEEEDDD